MPSTQCHSSSTPPPLFNTATPNHNMDLDAFHRHIAATFLPLSPADDRPELMSLRWITDLLEAFLSCHQHFRLLLLSHRSSTNTNFDRLLSDHFDRSVKALDICNAARDGIHRLRHWTSLADIVIAALSGPTLSDGNFRRAKKALVDLSISMLHDKDSAAAATALAATAHRNRSFTRRNSAPTRHFRSLSWSVSRSWSAAKQLHAMAAGVAAAPPQRDGEAAAAVGAANAVLVLTMWALAGAVPCQDGRGGGGALQLQLPRQMAWAGTLSGLHDRIAEESRRSRRQGCGLLREIGALERCVRSVSEAADSGLLSAEEVRGRVAELAEVCGALRDGLEPLERLVREVFRTIVRSRTEGLDSSN